MSMSYDRIGNTRIREKFVRDGTLVGRKRSIFDKVSEIKQDIKTIIPELKDDKLIPLFSKIRTYYLHKKKGIPLGRKGSKGYRKLTKVETLVYEYMIKHNLNPSTTYRWFIATRLPQDIREKLAKGQIGQRKAMEISANRRNTKNSVTGLLMMEEIRSVIQKLDWR